MMQPQMMQPTPSPVQGEIRVLHKYLWLLALAVLVFIAAMTISCSSSSNNITTVCSTIYNPVGNWQITVSQNGGSSVTGYGAIDSAGLALFFDNTPSSGGTGDTLQLPLISGNCLFSGNIVAYAQPGGLHSGSVVTDTAEGTITSSTAISGSFSGASSGDPSGTFSLTSFSPLSGSATAVSGAKTAAVQGTFTGQPLVLDLTFTPSGTDSSMSFTTTNLAGCEAGGTFTQQATSNVFDVSITLMPTCPITGTFTGIGFESGSDYFSLNNGNSDTYLYANILDGADTFVMEIY
jgi:hypothetical protein